uniref:Uncharacterized protein n=1 Tax=Leishmania guyanensis TaxID=5670 RepID=A0A1E1J586_LEIGU|nr:hypothetical protein, conserved [Leishmania guyanensis]
MYQQQQGAAYAVDGAAKLKGPGMCTGGGAGAMNASFGGGAYCSGYNGAAAFDGGRMYGAGQSSMYGSGSMYGQPGPGSMMGDMNGEIIVTKLFSSRRDLDRLASAQDFSRRFDSNWGSYCLAGANGYGVNSAAGGSLIDLSERLSGSSMNNCGMGAIGMGPDGTDGRGVDKKMASAEEKSTVQKDAAGERGKFSLNRRQSGVATTDASKPSSKPMQSAMKPNSTADQNGSAQPASSQSATEANTKSDESKDTFVGPADKKPKLSTQQATERKPLPASTNVRGMAAPQMAKECAGAGAKRISAQETKPHTAEPIDDIPLLVEDVRPKLNTADPKAEPERPTPKQAPATSKTPTSTPAEVPNEALEAAHAVDVGSATIGAKSSTANGEGHHARPRSRPPTRPVSRLTSMSVVDFPEAEEVNDEMVHGGLHDPEKEAKEAAFRAEERREREAAARAARDERQRQRQLMEDAQKQREEEAQRRRQQKEEEARKRKDTLAKMDEAQKRERDAAISARVRQHEEEKRRFEDMKRAEDEKEAARAAALIAERQSHSEAQKEAQKPARSASRQSSRRPNSRPASRLRGAIPEQPPDLVAGQMKDTLVDEALGKPMHPYNEGRDSHASQAQRPAHTSRKAEPLAERRCVSVSPGDTKRAPPTPPRIRAEDAARSQRSQSPPPNVALHPEQPQKQSTAADVVVGEVPSNDASPASPSSNPTPQSQVSKNSRHSQPKEDKSSLSASKSGAARHANMVKTLVLVEEVRDSNHALTVTDNSVSYKGQTIEVTEVKTRQEDNFNYHSSVVHDVREAVCSGYNAAVLAVDAPNTAGRFDSPVWSILNRIVRTLLHENSNGAGELRPDFELTCAMGYLFKDKVKDLLPGTGLEAPFTKIGVNPSPIYGPRLTNLTYEAVTDSAAFEDVLTTTLSRASEDATVQSLAEGVVAAFVLIMQTRETDGKPDVYLSSLVVATAGADTFPYQSAISHTRNEYATVFHLVLGGPSCTCFMLNIADDDDATRKPGESEGSVQEGIERVLALLQSMATLQNYDLRSGSVKRFIKYVELSRTNAQARLEKEEDEVQCRKVERYLREQERLLQDAYRLLQDANINCGEGA